MGVPGLLALTVAVSVLAAAALVAAPAPVDGPQVAVLAAAVLVDPPAPVDGPQVAGLVALAIAAKTAVTAAITAVLLYPKNGSRDSDFSPKREQPRSSTPSTFRQWYLRLLKHLITLSFQFNIFLCVTFS
jgi:hypothetical protein